MQNALCKERGAVGGALPPTYHLEQSHTAAAAKTNPINPASVTPSPNAAHPNPIATGGDKYNNADTRDAENLRNSANISPYAPSDTNNASHATAKTNPPLHRVSNPSNPTANGNNTAREAAQCQNTTSSTGVSLPPPRVAPRSIKDASVIAATATNGNAWASGAPPKAMPSPTTTPTDTIPNPKPSHSRRPTLSPIKRADNAPVAIGCNAVMNAAKPADNPISMARSTATSHTACAKQPTAAWRDTSRNESRRHCRNADTNAPNIATTTR